MAAIHRRFELDVPGAGQRGVVDQTDGARIFLVAGRADVAADEQAARAGHRYRARIDGAGGARHSARTDQGDRSEEHTSELPSLMRISYAVFCLKKNTTKEQHKSNTQ